MKPLPARIYPLLFLLTIGSMLFSGCGNDIHQVNAITNLSEGPLMSAKNIEVTFSDSGKIVAKLYSPLLNRYAGAERYMEFPEGFRIEIFDSARVETTITGNWGKRLEEKRFMEARGNVIVRNEIRERQLNTEHLTWDEMRHRIHSDVDVKITTPDKVLYGKGLEANESFSWYRIINPTGEMMVNKDSI